MTKAIALSCEDWNRQAQLPKKGDYMIHPITGVEIFLTQPARNHWFDAGSVFLAIYDASTRTQIKLNRTMRW